MYDQQSKEMHQQSIHQIYLNYTTPKQKRFRPRSSSAESQMASASSRVIISPKGDTISRGGNIYDRREHRNQTFHNKCMVNNQRKGINNRFIKSTLTTPPHQTRNASSAVISSRIADGQRIIPSNNLAKRRCYLARRKRLR
ncbi:hypothetical protein CDAR_501801 [Caerostris darwini]|uniref:Uncharacterized protein n=1 Tax=Caerostris darwini TaxID=1538125 RepID=A0AAV4TMQ6_9ARAC|nr:hypothetical protein CDAR_501801 [Caerostris darwini]